MGLICNQTEWENQNKNSYDWYYNEYPFLKAFGLPIPYGDLLNFYLTDISKRNLPQVPAYRDCYEAVLSYFIYNFPRQEDPTRFRGRTWFELSAENFPKAVNKTFKDINNLGFSLLTNPFVFIPLGILILYLIKK